MKLLVTLVENGIVRQANKVGDQFDRLLRRIPRPHIIEEPEESDPLYTILEDIEPR